MPKIRDLGINAIPETMRPPEIGGGGGCHGCTYSPAECRQTYICDGASRAVGQQVGCWCLRCQRPVCPNTTHEITPHCPDCACPACGVYCEGTTQGYRPGGRYDEVDGCKDSGTNECDDTTLVKCSAQPYRGGLTLADIEKIKKLYQKKIEELDKYAKELGPKTIEEIDKREKELDAEREDLEKRRKELEKKK
jgi:hypothetical protein